MKIVGFVLVAFGAVVNAGIPKPEVLVGINVGSEQTGDLGGLEPRIKWSTKGEVAGCDVEGGVDMTISEMDAAPGTSLWGKVKKTLSFGDVSIRGDVDANAPNSVDLDVRADAYGTSVQLLGTAGSKTISLDKIAMTKDFSAMGGTLALTPKYDNVGGAADLSVGYAIDNTAVRIDTQGKKLSVAHTFTTRDTIAPTVNMAGDVSLSYTRTLDQGKITTTYTPNDSVKVQWSDGVYETSFKAPLDGYYNANGGIKINMKRTVGI